jgi:hypothetical protein
LLVVAFENQIERGVVMVFGLLTGGFWVDGIFGHRVGLG